MFKCELLLQEARFVRGLLGTGPPDPPSNTPRPPLLRGRFGIDSTSIRHRNRVKSGIDVGSMLNRCEIDAKSIPEERRARRIRGWGPAALCLINPSQGKMLERLEIRTPDLSVPNHKLQIASDLKSQSPNRRNFPQIAVLGSSNRRSKSRDL